MNPLGAKYEDLHRYIPDDCREWEADWLTPERIEVEPTYPDVPCYSERNRYWRKDRPDVIHHTEWSKPIPHECTCFAFVVWVAWSGDRYNTSGSRRTPRSETEWAFLVGLARTPRDAIGWLAYADWLDENAPGVVSERLYDDDVTMSRAIRRNVAHHAGGMRQLQILLEAS